MATFENHFLLLETSDKLLLETGDKLIIHSVLIPGPRDTAGLMYIEQITYTEPYVLRLIGGDDQRLAVFLAQRGLPGI